MSKQSQANTIYNDIAGKGHGRKMTIQRLVDVLVVSPGYAATLYNTARKNAETVTAPAKSVAATHADLNVVFKTTVVLPKSNKVEQFTRPVLREIRSDLEKDLTAFFTERGMSVDVGNMSFQAESFNVKLSVALGSQDEAARKDFESKARLFGLEPTDYGRTFKSGGDVEFRITAIKVRGKKYPIITERVSDGSSFKFDEKTVKARLMSSK